MKELQVVTLIYFPGLAFITIHFAMLRFHFDDPLDAVGVHAGGGSVGIFFVHFFAYGEGILWKVRFNLIKAIAIQLIAIC